MTTQPDDFRPQRHPNVANAAADLPRRTSTKTIAATPMRSSRVVKTLWPGVAGTLRLGKRFGADLVCVRYRQDATGLERYTTVELVVESAPSAGRHFNHKTFIIQVGYEETALRALVKRHGAEWDAQQKAWQIQGWAVRKLGLEGRVRPRSKHRQR